mmetsp:Transcript_64860/g.115385  ORF Transcript_64860/g.115385 Transcript_64860/m.115385 type:complete len:244 (-) Transcript_64860:619-1350(-)
MKSIRMAPMVSDRALTRDSDVPSVSVEVAWRGARLWRGAPSSGDASTPGVEPAFSDVNEYREAGPSMSSVGAAFSGGPRLRAEPRNVPSRGSAGPREGAFLRADRRLSAAVCSGSSSLEPPPNRRPKRPFFFSSGPSMSSLGVAFSGGPRLRAEPRSVPSRGSTGPRAGADRRRADRFSAGVISGSSFLEPPPNSRPKRPFFFSSSGPSMSSRVVAFSGGPRLRAEPRSVPSRGSTGPRLGAD